MDCLHRGDPQFAQSARTESSLDVVLLVLKVPVSGTSWSLHVCAYYVLGIMRMCREK